MVLPSIEIDSIVLLTIYNVRSPRALAGGARGGRAVHLYLRYVALLDAKMRYTIFFSRRCKLYYTSLLYTSTLWHCFSRVFLPQVQQTSLSRTLCQVFASASFCSLKLNLLHKFIPPWLQAVAAALRQRVMVIYVHTRPWPHSESGETPTLYLCGGLWIVAYYWTPTCKWPQRLQQKYTKQPPRICF